MFDREVCKVVMQPSLHVRIILMMNTVEIQAIVEYILSCLNLHLIYTLKWLNVQGRI